MQRTCVKHAQWLINCYLIGSDGKTAYIQQEMISPVQWSIVHVRLTPNCLSIAK